jgi:hypothetical protein
VLAVGKSGPFRAAKLLSPVNRAGAASYVNRIVKRDKPNELPVFQSAKIEFVANLKTAKRRSTSRFRRDDWAADRSGRLAILNSPELSKREQTIAISHKQGPFIVSK